MSASFLNRRLRRRRRRLVLSVVALSLCFGVIIGGWIGIMFFRDGQIWKMLFGQDVDYGVGFLMVIQWSIGYVFCLALVVRPLWRLRCPDSDPDLIALSRYGPTHQMMAEIDREVEEEEEVLSIGNTIKSLVPVPIGATQLHWAQVLLTRSWLMHLRGEDGHRMTFMRFDSILAAFRPAPSSGNDRTRSIVLIDRYGVRLGRVQE